MFRSQRAADADAPQPYTKNAFDSPKKLPDQFSIGAQVIDRQASGSRLFPIARKTGRRKRRKTTKTQWEIKEKTTKNNGGRGENNWGRWRLGTREYLLSIHGGRGALYCQLL